MREFELLGTGEDKPNPLLLERLKACAAVIDALGYKARTPSIYSYEYIHIYSYDRPRRQEPVVWRSLSPTSWTLKECARAFLF